MNELPIGFLPLLFTPQHFFDDVLDCRV